MNSFRGGNPRGGMQGGMPGMRGGMQNRNQGPRMPDQNPNYKTRLCQNYDRGKQFTLFFWWI